MNAQEVWDLAVAAQMAGRLGEAERLYRALQATRPTSPTGLNLGLLLEDQRRWADAEAAYREVLKREPDDPVMRRQLAFLLLRLGRYAEGWPYYEARMIKPGHNRKPGLSFPEWQFPWHLRGMSGDFCPTRRAIPDAA